MEDIKILIKKEAHVMCLIASKRGSVGFVRIKSLRTLSKDQEECIKALLLVELLFIEYVD